MWRSLRLQALADAPQAFGSTLQEWQGTGDTETRWRNRLTFVPFNLLARFHGEFVGMVGATEEKEQTVELISLWVAPIYRGYGIGEVLVNAVVAWATEQNASYVALDVREDNERARALHLSSRFSSVIHPSISKMKNHSGKRPVEEALFESGLIFTVVIATPYSEAVYKRHIATDLLVRDTSRATVKPGSHSVRRRSRTETISESPT